MEEQLAHQGEPSAAPGLDDKKYICYPGQVNTYYMFPSPFPWLPRVVAIATAPHPLPVCGVAV